MGYFFKSEQFVFGSGILHKYSNPQPRLSDIFDEILELTKDTVDSLSADEKAGLTKVLNALVDMEIKEMAAKNKKLKNDGK